MKKTILTMLFVALSLTSVWAQERVAEGPQSHNILTLTITSNGISKTDSIKAASYSMSKINTDSIGHEQIIVRLNIGMVHMNRFFVKVAAGDMEKTVDATVRFYGPEDRVIHTIQLKQAHIVYFNSNFVDRKPNRYRRHSMNLQAPILIVDGIKM